MVDLAPIFHCSLQELYNVYKNQIRNNGSEEYITAVKNLIKARYGREGLSKCRFGGCCSEYRNEARVFQHDIEVLIGIRREEDFSNLEADKW